MHQFLISHYLTKKYLIIGGLHVLYVFFSLYLFMPPLSNSCLIWADTTLTVYTVHCTVLYILSTVLYCTYCPLYCTVHTVHGTVLYILSIVLYCTVHTVHCTVLYILSTIVLFLYFFCRAINNRNSKTTFKSSLNSHVYRHTLYKVSSRLSGDGLEDVGLDDRGEQVVGWVGSR